MPGQLVAVTSCPVARGPGLRDGALSKHADEHGARAIARRIFERTEASRIQSLLGHFARLETRKKLDKGIKSVAVQHPQAEQDFSLLVVNQERSQQTRLGPVVVILE